MTAATVGHFLLKELKIVLPPTIYFFCAFNIIVLTTNLLARTYWFALSNFLACLMSWPFAQPLAVGSADLVNLALFGFVQMTLGLTFFTLGSRLVPARCWNWRNTILRRRYGWTTLPWPRG